MSKNFIGKVIKTKYKTITVLIDLIKKHKIYKKIIKYKKKIIVHDENNLSNINDTVLISYFRPISKNKSWIIKKIIKKNNNQV